MSKILRIQLSDKSTKPVFTMSTPTNKKIKCLLDTGADMPVWCGSEKLEDNKAAAEWGIKQAELIKKSEEITRRLAEKYTSIILSRNTQEIVIGKKG